MADYIFTEAAETILSSDLRGLMPGDRLFLGNGNDVVIFINISGVQVATGKGSDSILGKDLQIFFEGSDSISLIDLQRGRILDRNGDIDSITGNVTNIDIPQGSSMILGDSSFQEFSYRSGGSHTVVGNGGGDFVTVSYSPGDFYGFTDSDNYKVLVNKTTGESIRFLDVEIRFQHWRQQAFLGTDADEVVIESQLKDILSLYRLLNKVPSVVLGAGADSILLSDNQAWLNPGPGSDTIDARNVSGSTYISYGRDHGGIPSPSGVRFSQADSLAYDGWGGQDVLLGDDWFVYGSDFGDTISVNQGQVYSGDGDDLIYSSSNVLLVSPGPGNDTLFGRVWIMLGDGPNADVVNLQTGNILDGSGGTDLVVGFVDSLSLGRFGSSVVGSDGSDYLRLPGVNGGHHQIDGGAGLDRVDIQGNRADFEIKRSNDGSVAINSRQGNADYQITGVERIHFSDNYNNPIIFPDSTKFFRLAAMLDGSPYLSEFSLGGNISIFGQIAFIDTDNDRHLEFVTHWAKRFKTTEYGLSTTVPTENRLVILQLQGSEFVDITSETLIATSSSELSGLSRASMTLDLNGDGRNDVVYANNKEDGRSGIPPSNMNVKTSFLMSTADGRYEVVTAGPAHWFHGVGAAPQIGIHPALVMTAPTGHVIRDSLISSMDWDQVDNGIGWGFSLHWEPFDNEITGERYFVTEANARSYGHSLATLALVKWTPEGGWTFPTLTTADWAKTPVQYVQYPNVWNGDPGGVGPIFSFNGYKVTNSSGPCYTWGVAWHQYPDSQPLFVTLMGTTAVQSEIIDGKLYETQMKPFNWIEFYSVTSDGFVPVEVSLKQDQPFFQNNFFEALDFNNDGYEDLVVYVIGDNEMSSIRIYINDCAGGLHAADTSNLLPLEQGAQKTLKDVNGDGMLDLISWAIDLPDRTANVPLEQVTFAIHLGEIPIRTGPAFADPALLGAPGFNEVFYLKVNSSVLPLINAGKYKSGLDHYIAIGRETGLQAFAPHTWVHGYDGGDLITLREGNEKAFGYGGDDRVQGGAGNDSLDGGDGIDTAIFEKTRASYKTEKLVQDGATLWKVTDLATGDVDELRNIEKLEFAKATVSGYANPVQTEVSLDLTGTPSVTYRIYRAAFARDPDLGGLGYWLSEMEKYLDPSLSPEQNPYLLAVAKTFVESDEFKNKYGKDVGNDVYVLNLYLNALGRDPRVPDAQGKLDAGYPYWVDIGTCQPFLSQCCKN